MSENQHSSSKKSFAYFMWLLSLSFFAFQFVLRLVPGLVINELETKYGINSADVGTMSAMYYLGYAGMQIPVAVLLDRFKPHFVIALCVLMSSVATIITATADSWYLVVIARFFIGFGSAAGFLGVSKTVQIYFSEKEYAKMIGLSFSIGLMGALYGGRPLSNMLESIDYPDLLNILGYVGIVIAVLIAILFKLPRNYKFNRQQVMVNLKEIISNKSILILALANLLMVGTIEGFADVWGINFFMKYFSITRGDAATLTSTIFFGMLFGGPILAWVADKVKSPSMTIAISAALTSLCYVIIFNQVAYDFYLLMALMVTMGILCCYQVLVFSIGNEIVAPNLRNLSIAFLNSINMFGGSFFHIVIGNTINTLSNAEYHEITIQKIAISSVPVAAILGAAILMFVKSEQQVSDDEDEVLKVAAEQYK